MGRTKTESNYFNLVQQAEKPMLPAKTQNGPKPENQDSVTCNPVKQPASFTQKRESFWQICTVSQPKHIVGKRERRPSLLGENLDGRRQNPPEKIQLLDKVFSSVSGHSVEF